MVFLMMGKGTDTPDHTTPDQSQTVNPTQPTGIPAQNATEPEPATVPAATSAATADDEVNTEAIKALLGAEEDRNMSAILSSFSPGMERYWDIRYPSRDDLIKRYNMVWNQSSGGRHSNIRIEKTGDKTYDMFADYSYYSTKAQEERQIKAHVRFVFDNDNKIVSTYDVR